MLKNKKNTDKITSFSQRLAVKRPFIFLKADEFLGLSDFMDASRHSGAAAVLDEDGHIIGIFTERDLLKRVVAKYHDPRKVLVKSVMTPDAVTISANASIREVLKIATKSGYRYFPVVDDNKGFGMIDIRDLCVEIRCQLERALENETEIFASMFSEPYGMRLQYATFKNLKNYFWPW